MFEVVWETIQLCTDSLDFSQLVVFILVTSFSRSASKPEPLAQINPSVRDTHRVQFGQKDVR